ncbi:hypothetical protein EAH_00019610 [Eimeria acervulina]|uniref:Uncharacterized protein n=1 Tax=Eimeria acervulina TaxID=5801 RepID=U6GB77_EIMAC|nr:hypothetical protein EAH_00019610 [Eimeria acervulina]CDI76787.1 hypothetical protein EAH_00019610 [Eimeria acervulina]
MEVQRLAFESRAAAAAAEAQTAAAVARNAKTLQRESIQAKEAVHQLHRQAKDAERQQQEQQEIIKSLLKEVETNRLELLRMQQQSGQLGISGSDEVPVKNKNKCPAYRCSSLGDMQQMMTGVKAFQAGLPHSSGASLGTSQSLARLRHPQQQLPTPHAGHAELIDGASSFKLALVRYIPDDSERDASLCCGLQPYDFTVKYRLPPT